MNTYDTVDHAVYACEMRSQWMTVMQYTIKCVPCDAYDTCVPMRCVHCARYIMRYVRWYVRCTGKVRRADAMRDACNADTIRAVAVQCVLAPVNFDAVRCDIVHVSVMPLRCCVHAYVRTIRTMECMQYCAMQPLQYVRYVHVRARTYVRTAAVRAMQYVRTYVMHA
jgi:hypothetical protein